MPRQKEFDRKAVLDKALELFWAKGYASTSLHDLTVAMRLSKSSLYESFGDKRSLFLAALEHYDQERSCRALAYLDQPGSARALIEGFLRQIIDAKVTLGDRRGCLVGNTAMELAPHDPEVAARVAGAIDRMEAGYRRLLESAQARGELPPGKDPRALARFLTSTTHGLLLMTKADVSAAMLEDVLYTALSVLG